MFKPWCPWWFIDFLSVLTCCNISTARTLSLGYGFSAAIVMQRGKEDNGEVEAIATSGLVDGGSSVCYNHPQWTLHRSLTHPCLGVALEYTNYQWGLVPALLIPALSGAGAVLHTALYRQSTRSSLYRVPQVDTLLKLSPSILSHLMTSVQANSNRIGLSSTRKWGRLATTGRVRVVMCPLKSQVVGNLGPSRLIPSGGNGYAGKHS